MKTPLLHFNKTLQIGGGGRKHRPRRKLEIKPIIFRKKNVRIFDNAQRIMESPSQLANRFREVILNGTWVANTNFKDQLSNVSMEQATKKIGSLNTIAILASHVHYYIAGILNVLEGGTLDIKDKFSFDFPPVRSQEDWEKILAKFWNDSEKFAILVEQMTQEKLKEDFTDKKYGSYHRNINAMIEHGYYHLGQIVLIKKLI